MVYDDVPAWSLSLHWQPVNQAAVTSYVVVLADDIGNQWVQTPSATEATFRRPLHFRRTYQVTVRAAGSDGIVLGPATAPVSPIKETVQVRSVSYAMSPSPALTVTWVAARSTQVTGYYARLTEGDPITQLWGANVPVLFAIFEQALSATSIYQVIVRATSNDGRVKGPATAPFTPLVLAPTLTSLDYNPGQLIVQWQGVGANPQQHYQVTVASASGSESYLARDGNQITLPLTLDPTQTYKVTVCTLGRHNIEQGPASAPLTPLLTRPTNVSLSHADGAYVFTLNWTKDSNPAVASYSARVLQNAEIDGQGTQTAPPFTYNGYLYAGYVYTGIVRSVANQVAGPWTEPVSGPYRTSETYTYDALSRLTQLARSSAATTSFTYDAFGNLQAVESTAVTPGS